MLLLSAAFAAAALSSSNSFLARYSLANFIFSLAVNSDTSLLRIFSKTAGWIIFYAVSYGLMLTLP